MGFRKWLDDGLRRVGGARILHWLCLPAAALCLLLSAWVLSRVWNAGDPPAVAAWKQAATRIASRIGPGELVFVYPAGRSSQGAAALAGLPVVCDPWEGPLNLSGKAPSGIWIAGDRSLPGRINALLKGFSNKGTIGFSTVFLRHHWRRADAANNRKKR